MSYEKDKYRKIELNNFELEMIIAILDFQEHQLQLETEDQRKQYWFTEQNVKDLRVMLEKKVNS